MDVAVLSGEAEGAKAVDATRLDSRSLCLHNGPPFPIGLSSREVFVFGGHDAQQIPSECANVGRLYGRVRWL